MPPTTTQASRGGRVRHERHAPDPLRDPLSDSLVDPLAPVQALGGVVQRGKDKRERESRKAREKNPYSTENVGKPKPGGRQGTRLHAKAERGELGRRPIAPTVGPNGESLWDGSRAQMHWQSGVYDDVLDDSPHRTRVDGREEYRCCICKNYFVRKSDATNGEVHIEVDHRLDWRNNVLGTVSARRISYRGHLWDVYFRADALAAYNDQDNLQAMCQTHNGSKNGPKNVDGNMIDYVGPEEDSDEEDVEDVIEDGKDLGGDDEDDLGGGGLGGGILVNPVG